MKVVPHIDAERRARVVGNVLEAAKDYINQWGRFNTYARLARHLTTNEPRDELIGQVLTALLTEATERPFAKG